MSVVQKRAMSLRPPTRLLSVEIMGISSMKTTHNQLARKYLLWDISFLQLLAQASVLYLIEKKAIEYVKSGLKF